MTPAPTFRNLSTWHLANLAECTGPDRADGYGIAPPPPSPSPSPGALFLRRVADEVATLIGEDDFDPDDVVVLADDAAEVADGAVPIYTHERWEVFLDLCAYQEDPEGGSWPDDLTDAAAMALFQIAERLAHALVVEWSENRPDEDDDEEVEAW